MTQKSLQDIFSEYLNKKSIFKNKEVLTNSYLPEIIYHRDKQIKEIAAVLYPALKNIKPSNLFIYGSVGTGKTLTIKYVLREMEKISKENEVNLKVLYLNCKMKKVADTEYRVFAQLTKELGEEVPATGLPTEEVYNRFFKKLDEERRIVILVLDEIDALYKKIGDNFLYTLTRINEDLINSKLSIVGISNDLNFTEYMDSRVKSSLSEEEVIFPPYNAFELTNILNHRAKEAFNENVLEEGVIQKCAALAAQEHGDARRALDLLRVSGEIAEREGKEKINLHDVERAREKIENDRTIEVIKSQTKQNQLLIYAILNLYNNGRYITTGEVYKHYSELCKKTGTSILTSRRVSDLITELDLLGLITSSIISKGRYGRTRVIEVNLPEEIMDKIEKMLKEKFYL